MGHYDVQTVRIEWQNRNKNLEAQLKTVQTSLLKLVLLTKEYEDVKDAVKYTMNFIESDARSYHIKFVMNVLPLLLTNPTPTSTHQQLTTKDPRTTQKHNSKEHARTKASNVNHRRSERIRGLQEDSKKPTLPPV